MGLKKDQEIDKQDIGEVDKQDIGTERLLTLINAIAK
jgi:hypothetical protein